MTKALMWLNRLRASRGPGCGAVREHSAIAGLARAPR